MKLKSPSYYALLMSIAAATMITACQPSDGWLEESNDREWQDISDTGLPKLTTRSSTFDRPQPVETDGIIFENSVSERLEFKGIQQFQLASSDNDKCPKLISSAVDSSIIERKPEVLRSEYCDYHLYPQVGQTISVQSEPENIQAHLVTPAFHDFENGGYYVDHLDKYVIRLDYAGTEFQKDIINYDVAVTIE